MSDPGMSAAAAANGRRWLPVFRLVVSAGILWLVLRQARWEELLAALRGAHVGWLLAAVGMAGGALLLSAWRWHWCLRAWDVALPGAQTVRLTLAGHAAGFTGLGAAGTDVTRTALLRERAGVPLATGAGTVVMDHAAALPVFAVVALAVLHLLDRMPPAEILAAICGGGVVLFFLIGWGARRYFSAWERQMRERFFSRRWMGGLGMAVLLSAGVLLFQCSIFICTARAVGVEVSATGLGTAAAAADVVAALPVSVAGLGVREQTFVSLLGKYYAVPAGQAAALSVAGWAAMGLWAIAGAACLFRGQRAGSGV